MATSEEQIQERGGLHGNDVCLEALHDVLSDTRRRFVIAYLKTQSKPVAMADVADQLARWECETPSGHMPDEHVKSRHIALHHAHVPKLAEAEIIEYDEERETVELTDEAEGIPQQAHQAGRMGKESQAWNC